VNPIDFLHSSRYNIPINNNTGLRREIMSHDLSRLFSGGRNKPTFEVKLAKRGPKSGRPLKIATHNADGCYNFLERNKEAKPA
jgi:hypothetical protein